ncbi:MAG: glycosyltransferase family 2 protein [Bacteroidales bacterium]|nr:glycosyltransferase family 2 protein [Bacteroidales bacterium]
MKPVIDLILPCYNPAPGWAAETCFHARRLQRLLGDVTLRLTVVDDGSVRNVGSEEARQLADLPLARIVGYGSNRGKGYALRYAVRQCDAPYIIYTDLDFPFGPDSVKSVFDELENNADVVSGDRSKSYYSRLPLKRKITSKLSRWLNRRLLRIPVSDTQSGLKGFNRKGRELFLQTKIDRFLFDTEFIFKVVRRSDLTLKTVRIDARQDIAFSNMGIAVLRKELKNFLMILFRRV